MNAHDVTGNETEVRPDRLESESRALSRYLDAIGKVALLEPADEMRLSLAARAGDDSAAKRLAEANLRLVVHVASRYSQRGVPLRDLIAAGNMGLMRAIRTFEARPDARFANYAIWWIRRHILRALMEEGRSARIPLHRLPALATLRKARADFLDEKGREPDAGELAEITGLARAKVVALLASGARPASLQAPLSKDGDGVATLSEVIADDDSVAPDEAYERHTSFDEVTKLLGSLSAREADILRARFGLEDGESHTCEEIGRRYGLTRERVRQIQDKALRRLRKSFEKLSTPSTFEERLAQKLAAARDAVLAEFVAERSPARVRAV